jgi:hypothetical protein
VQLPAIREDRGHRGPRSQAPRSASAQTDPKRPLDCSLSQIDPVRLRWLSDRQEERLWNEYLERYHPLGYKKPFGYWAHYFIESAEHRLGCILLSGAAKALRERDRWIGWNEHQRLKAISVKEYKCSLVFSPVFCVAPTVTSYDYAPVVVGSCASAQASTRT